MRVLKVKIPALWAGLAGASPVIHLKIGIEELPENVDASLT